jgi:ComEC/Rec2-related protein
VKWPVALGLGMWSCVLLGNRWMLLWLMLGGLMLCLPLWLWKKAVPWVIWGWLASAGLLKAKSSFSAPPFVQSPCLSQVLVSPTFLGSNQAEDGEGMRGIWEAMDGQGRRFRLWMEAEAPPVECYPLWAWVILHPIPQSDVADAFSFEAYLSSSQVRCRAEFLEWDPRHDPGAKRHSLESHVRMLAGRWRRWLSARFSGQGKGLILGMFAGDRKAVPSEIRQAFEHLGLAHLLAVSGYHVGLVSGPFLLLLRAQNRWLKRMSFLGIVLCSAFVLACGAPVSGVRSWVMVVLAWWLVTRGRASDVWSAWGAAGCLAVLRDVHVPQGLGAQLSFLATGSLLALSHTRALWRVPLRAQMSTAFLTVPTFQTLPWAFYPANLLAGPMMFVFGATVALGLLGPPVCADIAMRVSQGLGDLAVGLDERWKLWSEGRRWAGASGRLLLLPLGAFWVIRMIPGHRRRPLLRFALCTSCIVCVMMSSWRNAVKSDHPLPFQLWLLKAKKPCTLVTDGYGGLGWCAEGMRDQAIHAATSLGLEGPVVVMPWRGADSLQKKWIQPPLQAWIHQKVSKMTSEPVPLE